MTRRYRLTFLGLSLVVLFVVGWLATGSIDFVLHDFWFSSGLLLMILLSVVDQPFFSKDANIFMNGVAGAISLVAVSVISRNVFWYIFLGWSLYLVTSSFVLMLLRTRKLAAEPHSVAFLSRLNRQIGRPEAVFSAFFLWGVMSQFTLDSLPYRTLLLYWAVFLILDIPLVSDAISGLFSRPRSQSQSIQGHVSSFISPRFLECEFPPSGRKISAGDLARIRLPVRL